MIQLPNYFIADLPPEARVSSDLILQACKTLKHNREHYLANRSTDHMIQVIVEVAQEWLNPTFPMRQLALKHSPAQTGFQPATVERGINSFFAWFTEDNLHELLEQELGGAGRLDDFAASETAVSTRRSAMVRSPELLVHVCAGNLPNPTWTNMLLGALIRSSQFVKCASGASCLPRLLAHSLYRQDAKLGACLEIAEWPGGKTEFEDCLFAEAACVTATGSDETLAAVRARMPSATRFVGYGHQVSFAYLTSKAIAGSAVDKLAVAAATDVIAWNQKGCLSPHVFYVEEGGANGGQLFAARLAEALNHCENTEPRGPLPVEESAVIATRRASYELRAARLLDTLCWFSPDSTAWSVVYEAEPRFQLSCLNRFIYVKSVPDLTHALHGAESVQSKVSTVGLAATTAERKALALHLARWGVRRICPIGQMQNPPLSWRHDGRPVLGDWLNWTDWEY
jgi:hypothetical protein